MDYDKNKFEIIFGFFAGVILWYFLIFHLWVWVIQYLNQV